MSEPKSFEKLQKFIVEVLPRAFCGAKIEVVYHQGSKYEDEHITVLDTFEIYRTELNRWLLTVAVTVPGVRYRMDGSGEPDDCDVVELGEFDHDESLIWRLAESLLRENLQNAVSDYGMAEVD